MQYDKKLLLQMINDPSVPNDEKEMYKELIEAKEGADYFEKKVVVKEEVEVKKPTAKKKAPKKKKKVSEETLAKAKAAIKKRTGKTEEECEKIVGEYRKLRGKATKRKKKETERVSKLKKKGKIIKGTDEKTPAAAIDTTAKQVEDKIEKEVKKTERKAKKGVAKKDISAEKKKEQVAKKVSKKIATMTRSAITSTNKLISSTLSELKKVDKSEAKDYLLGLRAKIDTMLKKFNDGGMVQGYDIQEGLISVGNNASYAKGGNVRKYKVGDEFIDEWGSKIIIIGQRLRPSGKPVSEDEWKIERRTDGKGKQRGYRSEKLLMNEQQLDTLKSYAKGGNIRAGRADFIDFKDYVREMENDEHEKYFISTIDMYIKEPKDYYSFSSFKDYVREMENDEHEKYIISTTDMFVKERNNASYAHGGRTQGYNDRLDESLGMRRGWGQGKKQSYKDRRDESKGMEKGLGRRAYKSVGTMDDNDAEDWERGWKMKKGGVIIVSDDDGGEERVKGHIKVKIVDNLDDHTGYKEGTILDVEEIDGDDYMITKEGAYLSYAEVDFADKESQEVYSNIMNKRYDYAKGGKTDPNWGQKVEDSPDFDEGGFSREAAKRGLSTQQLFNRVMKNPHHYPEKMHDQAIFMQNFYKFKIT